MVSLKNHRALITGASSGIGMEMARHLARQGCDLILTARRQDRLDTLAKELRSAHGVQVRCVALDLGSPGAAARLHQDLRQAEEHIDILVNNAGFGLYEPFGDVRWERQAEMLQLNIVSLTELSYLVLADMRARDQRAYILNIGSIGGHLPVPYMACYGATKAYVRSFSEALAHELQGSKVSVTCATPGAVWTEFLDVSGQRKSALVRAALMDAERVAELCLKAMLRGRRNVLIGWHFVLLGLLLRLVPSRVAAWGSVLIQGRPRPRLPPPSWPSS